MPQEMTLYQYGKIKDPTVRERWQRGEARILELQQAGKQTLLELGKELLDCREANSGGDPHVFWAWVRDISDLSQRTAKRAMIAYQRSLALQSVGNITPPALEILANDAKTSSKTLTKLLPKIRDCKRVTSKEITKWISEDKKRSVKPEKLDKAASKKLQKAKIEPPEELVEALAEFGPEDQNELVDSVVAGWQTLEKAIETGEAGEEPIEVQIARINKEIEAACQTIKDGVKKLPEDFWLDHRQTRETAVEKIRNAIQMLRLCKCASPCPTCEGQGCDDCYQTGRVPRSVKTQLHSADKS